MFDIPFCILESVAELRVQVAALTTHDIDADSAIWTCSSIIDDRSSCRFSDDEEVSEHVYVYLAPGPKRKRKCLVSAICARA